MIWHRLFSTVITINKILASFFYRIYLLFYFLGLNSCEINCDFLYGQGYDGAANMAGKFNGAQTIIRSKHPKALYVHCAAHSLNLAISSACNI